jgi:hypothetical protein
MRRQLRPFMSPAELSEVYASPFDHTKWAEHVTRVQTTIDITTMFAEGKHWHSAADLSAGDGAIIKGLYANGVIDFAVMGDLVPQLHIHPRFQGLIQDTLPALVAEYPPFDLFILSETIEHLEDPDEILHLARDAAKNMVLSTPVNETKSQKNWEHYWSWDVQDVSEMLTNAGWTETDVTRLDCDFYTYQIWTCSHE